MRPSTSLLRTALAASLLAATALAGGVLAGCHPTDSNQVRPSGVGENAIDADLVGSWTLESIDGAQPPVLLAQGPGCEESVTDAVLVMNPDSTYAFEMRVQATCDGQTDSRLASGAGDYQMAGDEVLLLRQELRPAPATVEEATTIPRAEDRQARLVSVREVPLEYLGGVGHLEEGRLVVELHEAGTVMVFQKRS